jgi:DNA-directed RNA polymerase specialized sigma24 family protein
MSKLDCLLQQLALAAQQHPSRSLTRNRLLSQLFRNIQQSGELGSYQALCPRQLKGNYSEIYAEALQRLFYYITKQIDDYTPDKGKVIQWANGQLRWKFMDAIRDWKEFDKDAEILSLDELEQVSIYWVKENLAPSLSEQLIEIVKEDPQGIFQQTYTGKNPRANFRYIALKRNIDEVSWSELSEELGVKLVTLSNFYRRCLDKFAPLIIKYLSE